MGSVIDYIQCPHCKQDNGNCHSDFNYKTGEEFIHCQDCGYSYIFRIKRDENNIPLKRFEDQPESINNLQFETIEMASPYGSYKFRASGSIGYQCGSFETETDESVFIDWVQDSKHQIEYASISKLINNNIESTILVNNENETHI